MNRSLKAAAISAAKAAGILLAILLLALGAVVGWFVVTYDDELVAIEQELRALPGVTLIGSGGNEDITLEDIYAKLWVEDLGTLFLRDLTMDAFDSVDHLRIGAISDLEPRISGCGYIGVYKTATGVPTRTRFWGRSIDVGPGGPFASELGGGISSIPELIERYREVEELFRSWPRCPEALRHEDADGTVRYRSVAPADSPCWPDVPFPSVKEAQGRC